MHLENQCICLPLPADSKPISLVLSPMEARSFGNAVARVHYTSPNSISLSYEHFKLAACEFLARRPLVDRHMTAIPFWFEALPLRPFL